MTEKVRPQQYRVNHPMYNSYGQFLHELKASFYNVDRLFLQKSVFKNGAPWLQTHLGPRGLRSELKENEDVAYVPIWIEPNQFNIRMEEMVYHVGMMLNSLIHTEDRPSLVKKIVGIAPYMEVRQDKDGPGVDGDRSAGEAIDAEVIGRQLAIQGLNGQKLVWLGPHSYEAYNAVSNPVVPNWFPEGVKLHIETLPISSAPIFADKLAQEFNDPTNPRSRDNTVVVSLDKGSLQQCIHFSELLGLDLSSQLAIFDKKRKEHNQVADLSMIYGNREMFNGKDVLIYDDIIDTFGSMEKTCKALKTLGAKSITVIATHGVLSHPARDNILRSVDDGLVDRIMLTNSLPYAADYFEGFEQVVDVLDVASYLGKFAQLFSISTLQEMVNHPVFSRYITIPEQKEEVWQKFQKRMGLIN